MNSKKNSKIGDLTENVAVAIAQEKCVNQDIPDFLYGKKLRKDLHSHEMKKLSMATALGASVP